MHLSLVISFTLQTSLSNSEHHQIKHRYVWSKPSNRSMKRKLGPKSHHPSGFNWTWLLKRAEFCLHKVFCSLCLYALFPQLNTQHNKILPFCPPMGCLLGLDVFNSCRILYSYSVWSLYAVLHWTVKELFWDVRFIMLEQHILCTCVFMPKFWISKQRIDCIYEVNVSAKVK